jgi:hypothetical protein
MSCSSCGAGAWVQLPYDAAMFTASGSMVWTVEPGDIGTLAFSQSGKTVDLSFNIVNTTISGTVSSELRIALPDGFAIRRPMLNLLRIANNVAGQISVGYALVTQGQSYIRVTALDGVNFPLVTNGLQISGQLTFEIV